MRDECNWTLICRFDPNLPMTVFASKSDVWEIRRDESSKVGNPARRECTEVGTRKSIRSAQLSRL